ncbi:N-acetylneuraminate synthase family protein [Desulfuromonas acetoxidans]|uniref:N-acetylneuraminate synthase n=1 Tax=Desulfuromonas acetoxidans (strain DSM 684 / 11070) TaxID=281689 RepID=Q1K2W3_DESA6|nr:N-acetylneuraminate synthase family protein [Desulfuromonas acetoxidans]EAT16768.1 N-acetylneuraminate synthase [Desulfuromonas acetoxidans DSM 684]MBF0644772.1 N-acetylneuraminate synthase family protein [Desulfuromonas acetoxidans]NVD23710.1 N-acetylneuraminate synthase family protein [Desulfuromonas acetoxidans]NVE15905.1 N-acetylneuraminate synthase family protein [Desulfuromonas acetoxidans]
MDKITVVAEVGCNHKGDMTIAKELIATAAIFCKVDAVKFQKRSNRELLTPEQYNTPHPNPMNSYGATYGEHREFLEFDQDQHRQLKQWCDELGVVYSCSVWDLTSAKEIAELEPKFIKIPSASNQHYEMLEYLCKHYDGEIHASVGMTTHQEEQALVRFFEKHGRAKDLVIYSCTSGYPVSFEDICLLEVTRLKEQFEQRVKAIGFSGHHLGIAADIGALTLGATYFERHFTLDRTWKGTDHAASLEPDGMRRLTRDLRNVSKSLRYKSAELLNVELPQRKKLKWGEYNKND